MAERLYADNKGQDEAFLLATCHYRMNNKWACKEILEEIRPNSSNNKFLYSRVLVDLKEDDKGKILNLQMYLNRYRTDVRYLKRVDSKMYKF
jgi:hypothetical protein